MTHFLRTADNQDMHRSGGGCIFRLLVRHSPPPGDVNRYPARCAVSPLQRRTFDRLLSYTSRLVTSDRLLGHSFYARAGRSLTQSPLHPGPNSASTLDPLLARRSRRFDSP
ncbi:hypothetical protein, partial [Rubripirellula obstinata]|uniref:hypothetical protein n=1 Tax=Rubripirellula obstinata TaxID=406547 RepID=UPI001EE4A86B